MKKTTSKQPVNRTLYHGDNLMFLRGIDSGTIDLIATDPPFNKGKDFHATPESVSAGASFQDRWNWDDDVDGEWVDKLEDDFPDVYHVVKGSQKSYGDDMGAFLCFMAVRLLEMKRVLKPEGSLYLHCDPTASHYLKELMDAVFGKDNFRNEIIWYYKNASRGKRQFAKSHDVIFWYSKTPGGYIFNREDILIPYESGMTEWRYKKQGKPVPKGKTPDDVIVMPSINTMSKERTGYPTQKPLELYEDIIKASSNPGDVVLDPFCGCATTLVAAEILSRQWIGIDLWDKAHNVVIGRLDKEASKGRFANTDGSLLPYKAGNVIYTKEHPERTDDGEEAAPVLKPKVVHEPPGPKMSRAKMFDILVKENQTDKGIKCIGCNRVFDDPMYLQLDHNTPRSQGGLNHISNRMLLCGPCNRIKSNDVTIEGLWKRNRDKKRMA